MYYVRVLTTISSFEEADYIINSKPQIGQIVQIPIGKRKTYGIIKELLETSSVKNIKEAIEIGKSVGEKFVKFIESFAKLNLCSTSHIVKYNVDLLGFRKLKEIKEEFKEFHPNLNEEQQLAFEGIKSNNETSVLWGVTGSGKTEVFFALINEKIKEGKQVLLILPEIAITESIVIRFFKAFGFKPIVWHSSSKNKSSFAAIFDGSAKIIIGSRSSIMLPIPNLGIIIIDEEHDRSYKQQNVPTYNCRDMSVLRGMIEKIPVVLASATPSVETYFNVKQGKYKLFSMNKRYGDRKLPDVSIERISAEKKGLPAMVTDYAMEKARSELLTGGQVLFFLNRRGFAPIVMCTHCAVIIACPKCQSNMVFHKNKSQILCHKCNFKSQTNKCFICENYNSLTSFGFGVEKVCEELKKAFPDKSIEVISSDTCSSREKIIDFIDRMKKKEIDIVVGTQILSKGHDFPEISLVVLVNMCFFAFDFRLSEVMMQNLIQVGGRGGRGNRSSEVIIQTNKPQSTLIDKMKNYDYKGFLEEEIEQRRVWELPPFFRIIMISSKKNETLKAVINECKYIVYKTYEIHESLEKGKKIFKVLFKIERSFKNIDKIREIVRKLKCKVDVDPYDLL